jgi:hypothetical protein
MKILALDAKNYHAWSHRQVRRSDIYAISFYSSVLY